MLSVRQKQLYSKQCQYDMWKPTSRKNINTSLIPMHAWTNCAQPLSYYASTIRQCLLSLLLLTRGRAWEGGYNDTGTCSSNCSVSRMLIQVFLSFGMIEKCSVVYSKRHPSTPSVTTDVNREFIHIRSSEGQVWRKQGLTRAVEMVDQQSQELGYKRRRKECTYT